MPTQTGRRAPAGYVDMAEAVRITGLSRVTLNKYAPTIPSAIQRTRKAPWYFTEAGLRQWIGIEDQASA